ncbi:LLM class flavin-dependent oxidoreductase [Marinactinospora thermotolerans]|uniref:Luciferase family oxidoreductase, group 1 n=1 Tax=Marinactinospora thermotolerans DSM 45154 TaxID=1122192 RepID=A0A1T4LW34_9ACTN|nr:LLM class flavin-dependent oxidoreductase [Marinactinospora thermotolerans]SJZ58895.1 luciferase family oxidoreductase, group 1 [Marinactinospora thermotolerans DSM 45154]
MSASASGTVPLSILDLAHIPEGSSARDSLDASLALARLADGLGYQRIWYAEHHNMATIASSAPSVIIAHMAAHTERIRLGAGGVMLPNHAPLPIAEQFGTLETLHPGRIDLGLGRAPGSDQNTMRALRRDHTSADAFPEDVLELQGYLTGRSRVIGVQATPGHGTNVPLYILGSSLFGAGLAAALGLPYAFASHFAPAALEEAVALYRREFSPSEQLSEPYVIAGVNVTAADTAEEARRQAHLARRRMAAQLLGRGRALSAEEADAALASPAGRHVEQMMTYSAVGDPREVTDYLRGFAEKAGADELIIAFQSGDTESRLRSAELVAEAAGIAG